MNIKKYVIFIALAVTVLMVGCFSESNDIYEITIFIEEPPNNDLQNIVDELLDSSISNYIVVNWNNQKPPHIEEYPAFYVRSDKGNFETSNINEFEQYINSLQSQ